MRGFRLTWFTFGKVPWHYWLLLVLLLVGIVFVMAVRYTPWVLERMGFEVQRYRAVLALRSAEPDPAAAAVTTAKQQAAEQKPAADSSAAQTVLLVDAGRLAIAHSVHHCALAAAMGSCQCLDAQQQVVTQIPQAICRGAIKRGLPWLQYTYASGRNDFDQRFPQYAQGKP